MKWSVLTIDDPDFSILTSDRPVFATDGIGYEQSHLILPISPKKLFLAVNSERYQAVFHSVPAYELVRLSNDIIAKQSEKFVYDIDDRQTRFVENRLGKKMARMIGVKY